MNHSGITKYEKFWLGVGAFVSILTIGSLLGRWHWVLDLLSHFHIQYTLLLLIVSVVLLILRTKRALLLVPALLVNLFLLVPFFLPFAAGNVDVADTSIRVVSMNVSTSDLGYPKVVSLIREREPDIVYISEVREDLVRLLRAELGTDYPVQHVEPSRFTLGVAILARDPAVTVETLSADSDMGRMRRRYLRADFDWGGTPVTLVGIHPLPPMRGEWAYGRDREIGLMGQLASESTNPFLLVGDLNASPWSYAMRGLRSDTDLRFASDGYGIWPTWFVGNRSFSLALGAPLDHILISPDWQVVNYSEDGEIDSDHVPLEVDLLLQEKN